ncbi:MAG: EpsG family protein [Paludibacteraceae bacterium]|nr:EpsG family protein [Paludibacteraceae bacterium]
MIVVVLISILALVFTILQSLGIWKHGMAYGFMLTTFLLMIHYQYGNDYNTYYDWFLYIADSNLGWKEIFSPDTFSKDPGWFIISWLFSLPFGRSGFFMMVAVLSIIEGMIYYKFIERYVPENWYWLGMFVYLFHVCLYLLTFSMMRQSLAMALGLWAYTYIKDKKIVKSLLLLFLCLTIHKSSIVLLPFVFMAYLPKEKGKLIAIVLTVFLVLFLFVGRLTENIMGYLMLIEALSDYGSTYGHVDTNINFGLGYVVKLLTMYCAFLYYIIHNNTKDSDSDIIIMATVGILILPFEGVITLMSRINFYFQMFYVAAIPLTYRYIPNQVIRIICIAAYIMFDIYGYYLFWAPKSVFYEGYLHFDTVFSTLFN